MLEPDDKLTLNRESVAAQVIDGEAILIRLSDGTFYSMTGVGALMWELVEHAFSVKDIVDHITSCYNVDADRVERDLQRVAKQLVEEELAVINGRHSPTNERPEPKAGERLTYEEPALQAYPDMRDLLALDPPTPGAPWSRSTEKKPEPSE